MSHKHLRSIWSIWMFLTLAVLVASAHVASAGPAPTVATVQTVSGQLYVQRKGAKASTSLKVRAALYVGDTVTSGPKSKATILFSNGAVLRLNEKSAIEVTAPVSVGRGKESLFRVLGGEIWSRLRPGNAIQTKSAVLGVLGTEIHLVVNDEGTSTLTVIEGAVDFWNEYGSVVVNQSQQSVARPGAAPSAPVTVQNADLIIEWTVDLERAIVPREKFYISLDRKVVAAELERRAARTRAEPQNAEVRLDHGDALFDSGQFEAALTEYQEADRIAPTRPEGTRPVTLTRIGYTLLELDRLDESESSFRLALAAAPAAPTVRPVALSDDLPAAPRYAPALVGWAWLEISRNRPQKAQEAAQQALKASAAPLPAAAGDAQNTQENSEAYIALGVALMRQPDRSDAAAQAFQQALGAQPARYHYQARAWLALVRLAQSDNDGALREAQQAVEMAPQSGLARGNLALVYFFSGKQNEARHAAEQAVELNPKSVAARVALGQTLLAQGDVDEAETQAARAVALDPQLPQARYLLGVAEASRRDYGHATRHLEATLRMEPEFLPAASALARVYNAEGRPQDAVKVLDDLLPRHRNTDVVLASLGAVYYEQGRYDLGVTKYREALAKKPNSALYLAELSRTLLYANHLNEAINAGQQAVHLAPEVGQYHALLGLAYDFSGLKSQAEREYREALLRDPRNALSLTRLADRQVGRDQRVAVGSNTQAFLFEPSIAQQLLRGGVNLEMTPQTGNEQERGLDLTHRQTAMDGRLHGIGYFSGVDRNGDRANAQVSRFDVSEFVTFVPDGRTNVYATARGVSSRQGLAGSEVAPNPDDRASLRYGQAQIAARRRLSGGSHLWLGLFNNGSRNRTSDPGLDSFTDGTTGLPVRSENFTSQALLPELRYDVALNRASEHPPLLTLGVARVRTDFDSRRDLIFPIRTDPALFRFAEDDRATIGYAHLSQRFGKRLSVAAQLRAQHTDRTRMATLTLPGFAPATTSDERTRTRLLPSLLTTYQADRRTTLRLSLNERLTDPTALTLAPTETLMATESSVFPFGVPDSMRLLQLDVERYLGKRDFIKLFVFDATAKDVRIGGSDSLGFGGGLPAPGAPFLQLARWSGQGVGLRYEKQLGASLFANAGFTLRRTDSAAPGKLFDNATAPYEPRQLASFELNHIARSGNKIGLRLRHVGSFFQDAPGDAVRSRFPAGFYVDLRLAKEASVRGEIFFNVTNLFNRSQIEFRDFPTGRRRIEVGATRRF